MSGPPIGFAPYSNPPPYGPPGQPGYPPVSGPGYPMPPHTHQPQPGYPLPPVQGNWATPPPPNFTGVPPGLEYLTQVDQLLVQQKVELLEAFTGFETSNRYKVKNNFGQIIYKAKEDTSCCNRMCCGSNRPFDLRILDQSDREVIHLYRPYRCDSCWFPCFLQTMEVTASGTRCGSIDQAWSICKPIFKIRDASGNTVLRIEGPCCTFSICGDVSFDVLSKDGNTHVGRISKKWSGLAREMFTDADHFGISFPDDLDVNIKAVLLGAVFLIDFMFFEKAPNDKSDRPGMLD